MSRVNLRQQLNQLPDEYRDSVMALFNITGELGGWLRRSNPKTIARLQVWLKTRGA